MTCIAALHHITPIHATIDEQRYQTVFAKIHVSR
jgi:hypothetical protein